MCHMRVIGTQIHPTFDTIYNNNSWARNSIWNAYRVEVYNFVVVMCFFSAKHWCRNSATKHNIHSSVAILMIDPFDSNTNLNSTIAISSVVHFISVHLFYISGTGAIGEHIASKRTNSGCMFFPFPFFDVTYAYVPTIYKNKSYASIALCSTRN